MKISDLTKNKNGLTSKDIPKYDNVKDRMEDILKNLSGKNDTSEREMTLSVCMIVKNGECDILKAVRSMGSVANECVVVDTGSTDDTVKILLNDGFRTYIPKMGLVDGKYDYSKRLYKFEWKDDFSLARNYAQKQCSSDYILWLDADDIVPPETASLIKSAFLKPGELTRKKQVVFSMNLINIVNGQPIGESAVQPRIYPNNVGLKWAGKIHETFTDSVIDLGLKQVIVSNWEVHHYGYDSDELQDAKLKRNIQYLLREEVNPMSLYHMGTSFMCMKNYTGAISYYENILKYENLEEGFRSHVLYQIGLCLFEGSDYLGALEKFSRSSKLDAIFWIGECHRMLENFVEAKINYDKYLELDKISDPWGSKQVFHRYFSFQRTIQIMKKVIEDVRIMAATEFPEEPRWK